MNQARLIIYRSANGRDGWEPIKQHEVPAFVMRPDVIGRLVSGEMCMDAKEGDRGSDWYKAVRVVSKEEVAAQERREKRQAKRVTH